MRGRIPLSVPTALTGAGSWGRAAPRLGHCLAWHHVLARAPLAGSLVNEKKAHAHCMCQSHREEQGGLGGGVGRGRGCVGELVAVHQET